MFRLRSSLRPRRRTLGGGLAVAVLSAMPVATTSAGAAHAAAGSTAPPTAPADASASSTAFPVTIETTFGPVILDEAPERVVALDFGFADALVSLGVEPTVVSLGGEFPTDFPWLDGQLDPAVIDESLLAQRTINVEAIAAADPDVILGGWYAIDQSMFETLSEIAPTIPGRTGGNDGWEVRLELAAQAVGRTDAVDAVRQTVLDAYAELADAVPELAGRTYNYTGFGLDYGGFFWGNGTWLDPIGLVPNDNQDNSQSAPALSFENLDQLDADVWAIYPVVPGDREMLEADARFAQQPAPINDLVIWLDLPLANATNNAGPASLVWTVSELTPVLVAGSERLDD